MSEPSQSEMDVLVVGAGPTGLTMAAELAARGVGCRIVDKTPVRSGRSRALVIHARSLELLQKMGIADELVALGRRTLKTGRFRPTSRERSPHPLSSRLSPTEKGASYGCSRNSGFSTGRNVGRGP